ncbi:unnamed protein product [Brassica oleracea var. botrytis]
MVFHCRFFTFSIIQFSDGSTKKMQSSLMCFIRIVLLYVSSFIASPLLLFAG